MLNLLAFDLGASNGRAILGQLENGKITMKELHRFENNYIIKDGVFYWDLPYLFENLKQGLRAFKAENVGDLDCFGIDTWGVDYVCWTLTALFWVCPSHTVIPWMKTQKRPGKLLTSLHCLPVPVWQL